MKNLNGLLYLPVLISCGRIQISGELLRDKSCRARVVSQRDGALLILQLELKIIRNQSSAIDGKQARSRNLTDKIYRLDPH